MTRAIGWFLALLVISAQSEDWRGWRLIGSDQASFLTNQTLHADVYAPCPVPWDVQILNPTNQPSARKGDWLLLSLEARSAEQTPGLVSAYIFGKTPRWTQIAGSSVEINQQWKQIHISGQAPQDFSAESHGSTIHIGSRKQNIEFRNIELKNLGRDIDASTLPFTKIDYISNVDTPWQKEAEKRIEQHRKADLSIKVVNSEGRAVTNAEIKVQMLKHAYGFGTFLEYKAMLGQSDDSDKLREHTLKLFNRCTTPIYYADWGWENLENRRQYIECAQWAFDHGLPTRGHCVIYPGYQFMPKSAIALTNNPPALRQRLLDQIEETISATEHFKFSEYDVCNELRHLTELPDLLGSEVVLEWYAQARKYAPGSRMGVNENTILTKGANTQREQENYAEWIRYLTEHKQQPDVIGMQGHFSETLTPPDKLIKILDRFSTFDIPIHITEFDINTRDERSQGDYTRDFLTAIFSHPATEAITVWGFWEGKMWQPNGAMLRKDWSVKPNGQAWMDLIYDQWWTDEIVMTDNTGTAMVRGYLGDYEVIIGKTTQHCTLDPEGTRISIVVE